jgi:hypothetical protein
VSPHILYATEEDLTAGPDRTSTIRDTDLKLPGDGPAVVRGMQWFSNVARNAVPGTINHNERRQISLQIRNTVDDDLISRLPVKAAVFFRYDTSRWDCPCEYVVAPKAGFRVVLTNDLAGSARDVFLSIHTDIFNGMDHAGLQEAANLGLLGPLPFPVIELLSAGRSVAGPHDAKYRELRLDTLRQLRKTRKVPHVVTTSNDNISAGTTTFMADDDLRLPNTGAFLLKNVKFFFDAATLDETAGDDAALTTYVVSNNMLDRVDVLVLDPKRPKHQFMSDPLMAGTVARWDTGEWNLPKPYVHDEKNGTFNVHLVERLGVSTTDCYVAFHGYILENLSPAVARRALGLGLVA